LQGAVALCLALAAVDVSAQMSGSLTLVSNYRYRGVSLSHNDPAAQFALVYDHAQGWYAGAFASTVDIGLSSKRELQGIFFAGYAQSTPSGLSWEVGTDYSAFTGGRSYGYPEVYVGFTYEGLSGRLYYAPRYYGQDESAVYGEINGAQRLADRIRLLAHVGVFRNRGSSVYGVPDHVVDAKLGLGFDFDRFNVELSWVGISSSYAGYTISGVRSRNGPVLAISWLF
jgi:uncharacterized protein (TIGR02001 family)